MRAIANGTVIAESDDTVVVEGNHYFPSDSISWEFLERSNTSTVCHWKGTASYYDVSTDGGRIADAACTYEQPLPAAVEVSDRVAFWKGIEITE